MEEELGLKADDVEVLGILRCNWTEVKDMTGWFVFLDRQIDIY